MSVYITGDIHGDEDINKLNAKSFPEGVSLTDDDFLIIPGDFGLLWYDPPTCRELWWLKWLSDKGWTTLFVCGNHENHDMLARLPIEKKFGGRVGKVNDKIFYLKRGEVYIIDGKKVFTFGGAQTTDMVRKVLKRNEIVEIKRIEGVDWWPGELSNASEKRNAWRNLKEHGNEVDIIVAHTLPSNIIYIYDGMYAPTGRINDPTSIFMERICKKVKFKKYYCGHFHDDISIRNYTLLFDKIVEC